MKTPVLTQRSSVPKRSAECRRGAVMVLVVILLPVIAIVAMIAINLANTQLGRTELKVATDAAARAGGRAWSEYQNTEAAREAAIRVAGLNKVNGTQIDLNQMGVIEFGRATRANGNGRFVFSPNDNDGEGVDDQAFTSIRVSASLQTALLFNIDDTSAFTIGASSVASQVDRDIALVIDRSGSMAYYEDEDQLYQTITTLYEAPANGIEQQEYIDALADYQRVQSLANLALSQRAYSNRIINLLSGNLREYAETHNSRYRTGQGAAIHSRWNLLEEAMEVFFQVLRDSEQTELVSIASFASSANLDMELSSDLDQSETAITELYAHGSTAIGDGMLEGLESLVSGNARPDAIQTIIVFSDGQNKEGILPLEAAAQIKLQHPRTIIHTVTLADGDQDEMREVAVIGEGKHFHAVDGSELVEIFETLAGTLRTIITK